MKLIEEQPASKELEVPVDKELTSKKFENFMIKDAEHGLGETKKKRKKNEKRPEESLLSTPKMDRVSFGYFHQHSPCYFGNRDPPHENDENHDPSERHERIFAPCIIQQSMTSPSRLLNLSSPSSFMRFAS